MPLLFPILQPCILDPNRADPTGNRIDMLMPSPCIDACRILATFILCVDHASIISSLHRIRKVCRKVGDDAGDHREVIVVTLDVVDDLLTDHIDPNPE